MYLSGLILFIECVEAHVGAVHARYPFPVGFNGAVAGVVMYSSFSFLEWNSLLIALYRDLTYIHACAPVSAAQAVGPEI